MTTTRYGNKSVISEIRDDADMPYTKDGRRIDLLINLLAIVNRTTAFAIYELFITGSAYQVRQKMKEATFKKREKMLFDFIKIFNEVQYNKMYSDYKLLSKSEKEDYLQDAIDTGIFIHQLPLWETKPIFYRCLDLLKTFDFIDYNDLYIRKWGREIKVLTKYFVGDMYILKLKQSDRRGFSARSTGALDNKSLPTRSFKSRHHLEKISSSCIRFGEFETLNFSIGIPSDDIVLFHALYRTSIKGRQDLMKIMLSGKEGIKKIDKSYTSRVAEIFNVHMKSLGIGVNFIDKDTELQILNDTIVRSHEYKHKEYLCTDYQFFLIKRIDKIRTEVLKEHPIITTKELNKLIDKKLQENFYLNGDLKDDVGEEFEELVRKENEEVVQKLLAASSEETSKSNTSKQDV